MRAGRDPLRPPAPLAGRVTVVAAGLCALLPRPAVAQHDHDPSPWVDDVGIAAANVLAGGLTAGLTAAIRGHDVSDAFLMGAAGGAVWFAGKRVAVEGFDGAGLLGREVGALGSSVVANGGAARGWLEEVWLPLGPVWFQVSPRAARQVRIIGLDAAVLAWAVAEPAVELDWGRSLSNGALFFTSERHVILSDSDQVEGVTIGGVVLTGVATGDPERIRAHEMVHVIQLDFFLHAVSRPLEAWAWDRTLGWEVPVDLGVSLFLRPRFLRDLGETEAGVLEIR